MTLTPRRLRRFLACSLSLTTLGVGGLWLSFVSDLPTGPVVVCSFAATLGLAFVVRRLWTSGEPAPAGGSPDTTP